MTTTTDNQVELLVYSGRPNPVWKLTEEQITTLTAMLAQLPDTSTAIAPEILGYNGFQVTLDSSVATADALRVFGGIVAVTAKGQTSYRADADRLLETWLLDHSKDHIEPELYSFTMDEIRKN